MRDLFWLVPFAVVILIAVVFLKQPSNSEPVLPAAMALDEQLYREINLERLRQDLPALRKHQALEAMAYARGVDLRLRDYFAHDLPEGGSAIAALRDEWELQTPILGENLAQNNYPMHERAAVAVKGFADSPPHREVMLHPDLRTIGVAAIDDGEQGTIFVVIFGGFIDE